MSASAAALSSSAPLPLPPWSASTSLFCDFLEAAIHTLLSPAPPLTIHHHHHHQHPLRCQPRLLHEALPSPTDCLPVSL